MTDKQPDPTMMVTLQKSLWYIFVVLFGAITALQILDKPLAEQLTVGSIIAIVVATLMRVVVLSELFRRSNHPKYCMLSYLLFVILLSSAIVRFI